MRIIAAGVLVFLGGFAVMVLEIIGARFLANHFGSSIYVWASQIGMILTALALGYVAGGALGDGRRPAAIMGVALAVAGGFTLLIPGIGPPLLDALVSRHPLDQPIPALWRKVDPALGSGLIFFLPCLALAMLPPCMIRLSSSRLDHVGRVSGGIYAASTVGSILGVFVSGYVLIDTFPISAIFRMTGVLTLALGTVCFFVDAVLAKRAPVG